MATHDGVTILSNPELDSMVRQCFRKPCPPLRTLRYPRPSALPKTHLLDRAAQEAQRALGEGNCEAVLSGERSALRGAGKCAVRSHARASRARETVESP